ncbi:MAG: tRNA (guanosine(37)-N1)-methyltransferase TrmD [Oscillospiraceae bacterium]|jgi:tRNA (guanine37-N1)-methyltransferase|nr:tRNA (guanosine(37)-N1)-methyltransferase TrmD [Oscillospiraceae bacterium]
MRIDIVTLFPEMCEYVLGESIIGRARDSGIAELYCHNIRDYTADKHRRVDDYPYGGGLGMLIKAEPIANCFEAIIRQQGKRPHFIYMSPQGRVLSQQIAVNYAQRESITILCGHYEGVDERLLDAYIDDEVSIGDYVLTGGELPALVLVDAVMRMIPGVLAENTSFEEESIFNGLLEYPQYTRPEEWQGRKVPSVLLSGNHAQIQKWCREQSLIRTEEKRPDLYAYYAKEVK